VTSVALVRAGTSLRWALTAAAFGLALIGPAVAVSEGYPQEVVLGYTTGFMAWLIAGSIAWMQRPANYTGPLMIAAGVTGALGFLAVAPDPLGSAGTFMNSANTTFVIWVLLAAPSGHLETRLHRVALVAFSVLFFGYIRTDAAWVIAARPPLRLFVAVALLVLVLRRWFRASAPMRRSLGSVVVAGAFAASLFAATSLSQILRVPGGPGTPIGTANIVANILIPFGFLLGLLRLRMARGAVAELVVELGETPAPERLRDALAGALGDPSLNVVYWSAPFRTYLDANGVPVDIASDTSGRAVTLLERDGQPLAAILHDPALAEDPGLVAAVGAAVRLAVDNERLAAEVRSQLDEVQASRSRIVEASDAERRRVERNLHDGAQQRLVALSLALRRAQAQLPADAGSELTSTLEGASEQLKTALAELRELAKGIHPAILTEAGLGPALRSLAREATVPVTVRLDVPDDLSPPVAAAAYFVAAEALANVAKYAEASRVELVAETEGGQLRIEIADDGRGGADPATGSGLRGLTDRVAALGGRLDVRSPVGGGTRVVATLPLTAGVGVET
jgi:signal transduction histidine kinase